MPDKQNNLYLFEALEMRAEYEARIKELRTLLPEAKESRDRFAFRTEAEAKRRPAAGFSVQVAREELNALAARKRTLNNAIQRANFDNQITVVTTQAVPADQIDTAAMAQELTDLQKLPGKTDEERARRDQALALVQAKRATYLSSQRTAG